MDKVCMNINDKEVCGGSEARLVQRCAGREAVGRGKAKTAHGKAKRHTKKGNRERLVFEGGFLAYLL
jgi:hypothetical protein